MENKNHTEQPYKEASHFDGQQALDVSYFRIYGLNCPRCASRVKTALLQAPGVMSVIIEFPDGLAEVTYNPKQVTTAALTLAVQAAGDGAHHRYLAEWLE
jgi:copper chaperone CopZ